MALDCGEGGAVTPSSKQEHTSGGTNVQDHLLNDMTPIHIPSDTAVCDRAWYVGHTGRK